MARPGLHRLPTDSRVGDAIAAAGGYSAAVDIAAAASSLNLAELLTDGMKVHVPARGEAEVAIASAIPRDPSAVGPTGAGDGLIDLNTATADELESLPGVGAVTAAKIITAREEAPFASVDELQTREVLGAVHVREGPLVGDRRALMPRSGWLAAGAIVGALAATGWSLPVGILVCVAAMCGLATFLRRPWLSWAGLAAATVLLRAAIGIVATPISPVSSALVGGADAWEHEAVVLSVSAPSGGQQRAVLELRPPDVTDRVWATLPAYPRIVPADTVRFGGSLEPAPTDSGFGDFLARSGIGLTTKARALERIGNDGSPLAELEQVRRGAAAAISMALPEPQAGLAAAMSIGLRDLVPRDVSNAFRISGLSHVVAISGWHIAMLGAVVGAALAGIGRRPRTLIVLAAIAAYSLFAGASPSILRAAVMASVVLMARESGRSGSAAAGLALTVAGMLVIDPATANDIGFQLSVAATAGLLVWSARAGAWFDMHLPRRTPAWLRKSLAVSTAAQAATLPLILFHFASLSLVSPLANLLIAPLVAPAMLLTALAMAAGVLIGLGLPALLFAPLSLLGGLVIGATISIAELCAALPFATVAIARATQPHRSPRMRDRPCLVCSSDEGPCHAACG